MPRSSKAEFNEHGFAEVIRDVEELFLRVEDGTNDLNNASETPNSAFDGETTEAEAETVDLSNYISTSTAAGGDLTGTYPNPTIATLKGYTLTLSAVSSGQYLRYNGSAWVNAALTTGDTELDTQLMLTAGITGNARGTNAVDWQRTRTANSQVASGLRSTISGGASNTATGDNSTVCGGSENTAGGGDAIVLGGYLNTANGDWSIAGGNQCDATANYAIALGSISTASASGAIALGSSATASGANAVAVSTGGGATVAAPAAVGIGGNINIPNTDQGAMVLGNPSVAGGSNGTLTLNLHFSAGVYCYGDLYRGTTKVVGERVTGWGAPTGTATRTTFDTATVTHAQLAERVKALIDDLTTHGLIGA